MMLVVQVEAVHEFAAVAVLGVQVATGTGAVVTIWQATVCPPEVLATQVVGLTFTQPVSVVWQSVAEAMVYVGGGEVSVAEQVLAFAQADGL